MPVHSAARAVFRHRQDTFTNCGRACAQSVISSLVQSPAVGGAPPASTTPVPVDQMTLQSREIDAKDGHGDVWYTHPDELVALLKVAPELKGLAHHARAKWRIGKHDSLPLLMADVVTTLKKGVPPLVNIRGVDHWVVVAEAGLSGQSLNYLMFLDPTDIPSHIAHSYRDVCNTQLDGHLYAPWNVDASDLGALDFAIGTTPPPAGMKDYSGKFVTIAHGTKATKAQLAAMAAGFATAAAWTPAPVAGNTHPLVAELRLRAVTWGLAPLQRLLSARPRLVVRRVEDIAGGPLQHRLVSLYSDVLQYGLIGVFGATEPRLAHFRFTTSQAFERSLSATLEREPLWWARARQPSLNSPYYPFRRETLATGRPRFRRLIDNAIFTAI